jgi:oxygen-independent coproporphyrinogen III oxidase
VPGVYLSYPFCAQKCSYCNFASGVFPKALEPKYLDRLRRELEECRFPWIPETVYWGGGTPSLIDPEEFTALMAAIPGRPWREATLEAAPGTISAEKAAAWARAGIDRVSLGVQSFVEPEIRRTGRKHTAAIVESDVGTLRSAGIQKINLDLIAGLAGQTRDSWQASLDALLRLQPDHASVYMLEVDEDSRLGKELTLGGVRYGALDVPADERITEFYETAVAALSAEGLARYEISNFALPGHESLHNLKYWRREPYLGFGADAHSFDGAWRWANCDSPAEYIDRADPVVEKTTADSASEQFFLGLRLAEGVPAEGVAHLHFEDDGLLERSGGRLRLTPKGILLSNEVFQEFVA